MAAGVAVLVTLLHGAFSGNDPAEASGGAILELPSPPPLPSLRPNLEKTPLTYRSEYYLQLAAQAKSKLVLIGQERLPGLVVTPGVILTSIRAADETMSLLSEQRVLREAEPQQPSGNESTPDTEDSLEAPIAEVWPLGAASPPRHIRLIATDSELGIAVFEMEQPYIAASFSPVDPAVLEPGSPVLAVAVMPNENLDVTPGYLTSAGNGELAADDEPLHVSIAFPQPPAIAAIIDLDGQMVGAAVESRAGARLLSSNQILQTVDRLREGGPCRAVEAGDLTEEVRRALGLAGGVLVEKVRNEAFVPDPSIRPGDILLEWGGQEISQAAQFQALYDEQQPGALVRYQVLRNRRRVSGGTVVPGPDCRPARPSPTVFPDIGLTLQWTQEAAQGGAAETIAGWRILRVSEESPAAAAGVKPGDLVVALNGDTVAEADGERSFGGFGESMQPFILTLRRGERATLVAVAPNQQ